jgi:hypothetical protein
MKMNFILLVLALLPTVLPTAALAEEEDPPAVAVGERLFLETRFAQYFHAHATDLNAPLAEGDPTVAVTATTGAPLPGPFATQSMNCRACHMVDEQRFTPGGGNRTYADFARRSPIPAREDGARTTLRNSPALVGSALPRRRRLLLHFDAEFPTAEALVAATFTGRNFGWLPHEHAIAVAHIARVIREDDGRSALARAFGGSYRRVLAGRKDVPREFRLGRRLRIDVDRADDEAILRAVARLVAAYVGSLEFSRDDGGFDGSPFDLFLDRNGLPRDRQPGQSPLAHSRRVRRLLHHGPPLTLVPNDPGRAFALHDQPFRFGPTELRGLEIFLREPGRGTAGPTGNCVACHPLPRFTDFRAHNTGVAQRGYDALHGAGSFAALVLPTPAARAADFDAWLPATAAHPFARGPFRQIAAADRPGLADLGLWNIYQNPDFPLRRHQRRIGRLVCLAMGRRACRARRHDPARMLEGAVGLFKTPSLRDLGHSAPYLHDGSADTLEDVIRSYVEAAALARAGRLRNAAPELAAIDIGPGDVAPLAAFLRALNEDYE